MRVLHTVITEGSVSRAALKLASTQPAVSAQLKRLRALTGDALLVRAGAGLAPTATALQLVEPAAALLREAQRIFGPHHAARAFDPATCESTFTVGASDHLDPLFLPGFVARLRGQAPRAHIELRPLSVDFDYRRGLASGALDLVVGNWLAPPQELHLGRLFEDEVVCLVAEGHPAATHPQRWTAAHYLDAEHVAPTCFAAGVRGIIDEHLDGMGLSRRVVARSPFFGLIPLMLAQTSLVLTTGRLFCTRYTAALPLKIVPCPVPFPRMDYYQLWHDVTHASPAGRWLRELVRDVARTLPSRAPPARMRMT